MVVVTILVLVATLTFALWLVYDAFDDSPPPMRQRRASTPEYAASAPWWSLSDLAADLARRDIQHDLDAGYR